MRERLARAHLYLLFTPSLCGERDPLEVLAAALPWVDLIQVRPKASDRDLVPGRSPGAGVISSARDVYDWSLRVIDLVRSAKSDALVIVNDRLDVARSLLESGCAGVHLGQRDAPPAVARDLLGSAALIGLSTHDATGLARASDEPVDYVGFGPIHASGTKGYVRGLGSDIAWTLDRASAVPLFPLGGIDETNIGELSEIGRAAVAAAILASDDPAGSARRLRASLGP